MHLNFTSLINAPVARVWAFHERPDAIELLTPGFLAPEVERLKGNGLEAGTELIVTTGIGIRSRWHARHTECVPGRLFVDIQVAGPMRAWRHEHHFESVDGKTRLSDVIECEPPLGWLGAIGARVAMTALFAYRHHMTRRHCEQ